MTPTRRGGTRRRFTSAIVGLAAVVGALGTTETASAAESSRRTSSVEIAAEAQDALTALARFERGGRDADLAAYRVARTSVAEQTALALGLPARELSEAWADVDLAKQRVMMAAITQLGVPYRSNRSEEGIGFDCSGLMLFAYRSAGYELPRSSGDQFNAARSVDVGQAEPGDFVYYPGHISMYLGLGVMVHSPQSGELVEIRTLFDRSVRYADVVGELTPASASVSAPSKAGSAS